MPKPFPESSSTRLALAIALILTAFLSVACRVDSDVLIEVEADGSGSVSVEVTADADAAKRIGDPAESLRLSDVAESGWKVAKTEVDEKSGSLTLRASRPFRSSEELAVILGDIGRGAEVPFLSDVALSVKDEGSRTDYGFTARLHLDAGMAALSDPALTEALGGLPVGRTPEELAASGVDKDGLGELSIRLRLPAEVTKHNGNKSGETIEWTARVAADTPTEKTLVADAVERRSTNAPLKIAGLGLCAAAIVLAVIGLLRRHR